MKIEQLTFDPKRNDLELITKEHYNKQMALVRSILNLRDKEFSVRDAGMKIQVADSYIRMVFELGEEGMKDYWKKMYNYKESI